MKKLLLLLTMITIASVDAYTTTITNNTGASLTAEASFFNCSPSRYRRVIANNNTEQIKLDNRCCLQNVKLSSEKAGLTKKQTSVVGKTDVRGAMQSCHDNTFIVEVKNNELVGTLQKP